MPLDAHEEAQFRRIAAQLQDEDPTFGRAGRRRRLRTDLGQGAVIVLLVAGLVALPAAIVTGLFPLGLLGYLAATLASVRLADQYLARAARRREQAATNPQAEDADDTAAGRRGLARTAIAASAVAVVALVALAPGSGANRPTDQAPPPAASTADATEDEAEVTAPRTPPRGAEGEADGVQARRAGTSDG